MNWLIVILSSVGWLYVGYISTLIYYKVTEGEIQEWDYPIVRLMTSGGLLTAAVLILVWLISIMIKIPYRLIFGKEEEE